MVWSAALGLTEPAAGGAAPGCLDTEASHTGSPISTTDFLNVNFSEDPRLDPPTAVCLCVKRWIVIPSSQDKVIMRLTDTAGSSF